MLAGSLLATMSLSVLAQESYPRLVGDADSPTVEYAPGFLGNIVGGGPVMISLVEEGRVEVSHSEARFAQARADGLVPVMLGGEDDHTVTWIPSDTTRQLARTTDTVPVAATVRMETEQAMAQVAPSAPRQPARRGTAPRGTNRRS